MTDAPEKDPRHIVNPALKEAFEKAVERSSGGKLPWPVKWPKPTREPRK